MATIAEQPLRKTGNGFHPVKIDMTPMVDLGFLLITFFIFTTALSAPTVTKLTMPTENNEPVEVHEKTLLTAVLDKDKVLVYEGAWEKALAQNGLRQTSYNVKEGLGKLVREKQARLAKDGSKEKMKVLLKPLHSATYQNLIDALDEMKLNNVLRYAVVSAAAAESAEIAAISNK